MMNCTDYDEDPRWTSTYSDARSSRYRNYLEKQGNKSENHRSSMLCGFEENLPVNGACAPGVDPRKSEAIIFTGDRKRAECVSAIGRGISSNQSVYSTGSVVLNSYDPSPPLKIYRPPPKLYSSYAPDDDTITTRETGPIPAPELATAPYVVQSSFAATTNRPRKRFGFLKRSGRRPHPDVAPIQKQQATVKLSDILQSHKNTKPPKQWNIDRRLAQQRSNKNKSYVYPLETLNESDDDESLVTEDLENDAQPPYNSDMISAITDDYYDHETFGRLGKSVDSTYTTDSSEDDSPPSKQPNIFERFQTELPGTIEDTMQSFQQILTAFTLKDKEIDAVVSRIEKARRQMDQAKRDLDKIGNA